MSKRYVVLALFALLATPAVAVDGQLSSQEILARNAARNEENAARLTAAGCPVDDDAAILALSDKEFERCMETGFVGGLAGASYLAASAARLDLEWDRELDRCRETIGCIVIEGRFRRD